MTHLYLALAILLILFTGLQTTIDQLSRPLRSFTYEGVEYITDQYNPPSLTTMCPRAQA